MNFPPLPFTDPVLVFSTMLAVMLVAPLVFARLRLPGVIGIIVLGVAIGPNALGLLALDGTIRLLGTVGLLYIMFLAGLEINLGQFARQRNESLVFGAITFAIPQGLGTVIFLALGFDWTAAILIASMFASHTLVAYPVITRLGIARNRAVVTTVGGTILTDTVALLILAVVARSVQGDLDTAFWAGLAISLTLYVAAVLLILPRLGRWFFRTIQDQTAGFLFVLFAAFGVSYLARAIGIEPILGAFLAGLVLNRLVPESSPLMNRVQFTGNALFIPFFLLYIGMLVDLDVLAGSLAAWGVMGAMLSTNVLTKLAASKLTQRLYGYTPAEGWVIFGLSTTEAAATLAATLVGYELGIIGDEVLNGVILMILVTCIMGPAIVERFGRQIVLREQARPYDPADAPDRVLVPLANPETAETLLAVALAARVPGSPEPVHPLAVVPTGPGVEERVAAAEALLSRVAAHAASAGVPVQPLTRVDLSVAGGVARAVTEQRITQVVIGWNGQPSLTARIFGSVLDGVVEQTAPQLFVCKLERPLATHRRLVLAVPPLAVREPGFDALARAVKRLAAEAGVPILLLSERPASPPEHGQEPPGAPANGTAGSLTGDTPARHDEAAAHLSAAAPEVPLRAAPLSSFDALMDALEAQTQPDDLLVLIGTRRGALSWQAGLDRLPRQFADRLPSLSFVVAYPSERAPTGHALL